MEVGKMTSPDLDGDDKLFLDWFKHREDVEYHITYFDDHYEIYWKSERGIGDELNEFIEIFESPGERKDFYI